MENPTYSVFAKINGTIIYQRDTDGWIALTDLGAPQVGDRQPSSYLRLKETEEYILYLKPMVGTCFEIEKGFGAEANNPHPYGCTWAHPRLALHFASRCSPAIFDAFLSVVLSGVIHGTKSNKRRRLDGDKDDMETTQDAKSTHEEELKGEKESLQTQIKKLEDVVKTQKQFATDLKHDIDELKKASTKSDIATEVVKQMKPVITKNTESLLEGEYKSLAAQSVKFEEEAQEDLRLKVGKFVGETGFIFLKDSDIAGILRTLNWEVYETDKKFNATMKQARYDIESFVRDRYCALWGHNPPFCPSCKRDLYLSEIPEKLQYLRKSGGFRYEPRFFIGVIHTVIREYFEEFPDRPTKWGLKKVKNRDEGKQQLPAAEDFPAMEGVPRAI